MTRRNGGKELGEALLRGSAPMLAVEYDDDGIPKDLKPSEIMAFLNKLEAYNMTQVAEKDKLLALLAMTPEWIEFMQTLDAIRTVPKDAEDAESEMDLSRVGRARDEGAAQGLSGVRSCE